MMKKNILIDIKTIIPLYTQGYVTGIGKYSEFCERKTFTEANSLTTGQRHTDLLKKVA